MELQNGRPGYRALWHHFVDLSIAAVKENFEALDVHFDLWNGVLSGHYVIAPMLEALKKQKLAVESDGALVMDVALADDKKEFPPLILYKRDGAVMYGTTDLATIVDRGRVFQRIDGTRATARIVRCLATLCVGRRRGRLRQDRCCKNQRRSEGREF